MPRKKKEEKKEAAAPEAKAPKKKAIAPLTGLSFNRLDLNALLDKVNELVEAHNCDCK